MAYRYETNMDLLNLNQKFSFIEKVRIVLSLVKSPFKSDFGSIIAHSNKRSSENGRGNVQHRTGGVLSKKQHEALVSKASKLRQARNKKQ